MAFRYIKIAPSIKRLWRFDKFRLTSLGIKATLSPADHD